MSQINSFSIKSAIENNGGKLKNYNNNEILLVKHIPFTATNLKIILKEVYSSPVYDKEPMEIFIEHWFTKYSHYIVKKFKELPLEKFLENNLVKVTFENFWGIIFCSLDAMMELLPIFVEHGFLDKYMEAKTTETIEKEFPLSYKVLKDQYTECYMDLFILLVVSNCSGFKNSSDLSTKILQKFLNDNTVDVSGVVEATTAVITKGDREYVDFIDVLSNKKFYEEMINTHGTIPDFILEYYKFHNITPVLQ
jgi:hypothetical protein